MKEKIIVSTTTLIVSLLCYFYARHYGKDAVPYVMIGGFVGAFVGEMISYWFNRDNDNNPGGSAATA